MTTPTNWPNPERPGDSCRPPEGTKSETYHWLDCGYLAPFAWREGDGGAWWCNDALFSPAQMSGWGWKYVSPCLTPAQIAEMLAGKYSISVMAAALRVWNIFKEGCDRANADDMILLEQNGLMDQGIFSDAGESDTLEIGETIWTFNEAGASLVSAIRNLGAAP